MAHNLKPKFERFDERGFVYLEMRHKACRSDDEDDVGGYLTNGVCARIKLKEEAKFVRVQQTAVAENMRRQKLGTAMYEAAARLACKEFGKPLASDFDRSVSASGFWRKQLMKGRAKLDHAGRGSFFKLACPAPESLAGASKRRRRKRRRRYR